MSCAYSKILSGPIEDTEYFLQEKEIFRTNSLTFTNSIQKNEDGVNVYGCLGYSQNTAGKLEHPHSGLTHSLPISSLERFYLVGQLHWIRKIYWQHAMN